MLCYHLVLSLFSINLVYHYSNSEAQAKKFHHAAPLPLPWQKVELYFGALFGFWKCLPKNTSSSDLQRDHRIWLLCKMVDRWNCVRNGRLHQLIKKTSRILLYPTYVLFPQISLYYHDTVTAWISAKYYYHKKYIVKELDLQYRYSITNN